MSQFGIHAWAAGPGEFFLVMMLLMALVIWRDVRAEHNKFVI